MLRTLQAAPSRKDWTPVLKYKIWEPEGFIALQLAMKEEKHIEEVMKNNFCWGDLHQGVSSRYIWDETNCPLRMSGIILKRKK